MCFLDVVMRTLFLTPLRPHHSRLFTPAKTSIPNYVQRIIKRSPPLLSILLLFHHLHHHQLSIGSPKLPWSSILSVMPCSALEPPSCYFSTPKLTSTRTLPWEWRYTDRPCQWSGVVEVSRTRLAGKVMASPHHRRRHRHFLAWRRRRVEIGTPFPTRRLRSSPRRKARLAPSWSPMPCKHRLDWMLLPPLLVVNMTSLLFISSPIHVFLVISCGFVVIQSQIILFVWPLTIGGYSWDSEYPSGEQTNQSGRGRECFEVSRWNPLLWRSMSSMQGTSSRRAFLNNPDQWHLNHHHHHPWRELSWNMIRTHFSSSQSSRFCFSRGSCQPSTWCAITGTFAMERFPVATTPPLFICGIDSPD